MTVHNPADEKELLLRLQHADHAAFSEVFRRHYPMVYQFARKLSADSGMAEDLAGEVFLGLLEDTPALNDFTHLKAYLFRSVRYKYMDARKTALRAAARETTYATLQPAVPESTYLAEVMRAEAIQELRQAINTLPPQAEKIITMTYLEGKSNQEAADALNLSLQTVKNQKRRALALLKNRLTDDHFHTLLLLGTLHGVAMSHQFVI